MVCEYLEGNRNFIPQPLENTRSGKEEKEKILHRPIPQVPPAPKTYAGFGARLGAGIIDFLVFVPVIALFWWVASASRNFAIAFSIPYFFFFAFYNIYLHGRFGQTVGKMALKIKVVQLNGQPANHFIAFKRHAVDTFFSAISLTAYAIALLSISVDLYDTLPWLEKQELIHQASPIWGNLADLAMRTWVWSEVIVLLFNKKKRALHDFIAGTVVIHNEFEERLSNTQINTDGK